MDDRLTLFEAFFITITDLKYKYTFYLLQLQI